MTTLPGKKQKIGRNSFCPCGSGQKYKKCCLPCDGVPARLMVHKLPAPRQLLTTKSELVAGNKNPTAVAMLNAGVSPRVVYCYLTTGHYLTPANRQIYPAAVVAAWDAAEVAYDTATEDDRELVLQQGRL